MKTAPPPLQVPADWEEIRLPFNVGSGRTMYTGQEQDGKARFRFYRKPGDDRLYGRAWFGPGTEGPPSAVHGGALAYALDEAMGSLAWMHLHPVVALKLEFQYLKMSPLNVDLHLEATLVKVGKARLEIKATVSKPDGTICVEGKGSFAVLTRAQAEAFKDADPDGLMRKMKLKWADD